VTPTIGFTGHVNDADTGLVYMQQRYYDPVAGRFLSIDAVTTDANTGGSFNRYAYANNNPYKYIDPDGRNPWLLRGSFEAGYFVATRLGAGMLGSMIGIAIYDAIHSDGMEPKKDGQGSSDEQKANSVGGPTEGKRVPSGLRDEILTGSVDADGNYTCWRCGGTSTDPTKIDIGHKNTPRSDGGNLHPDNLACEGWSCNRSAGNRGQVKAGSDCICKGGAKPPEKPAEPAKEEKL
jgi:RHS repeat-associated protein